MHIFVRAHNKMLHMVSHVPIVCKKNRVGQYNILLAGRASPREGPPHTRNIWKLARIGTSRTWQTAARKYRADPYQISLGAGASPRIGPLHERNIWTISSHWPIKSMASAARHNRADPYNIQDEWPLACAPCVRIAFAQLAPVGPSRAWGTAGRDYRVDPHNILLVGGTSPCVGPLHGHRI